MLHPIPLPCAEQEAEVVANLVAATETVSLIRYAATAEAVARELPSARYVHLACHGSAVVSPQALDGGLYFAGNVALTAADLLELAPLQARLVIASACETGIIPNVGGVCAERRVTATAGGQILEPLLRLTRVGACVLPID
jgi:CHAT domain-containing protein